MATRRPNETASSEVEELEQEISLASLRARVEELEARLRKREAQRRALLHILSDLHDLNKRLSDQRKATIHIMGDLHETTAEIARREQELREKQEQLVQAAKLATLGELTTGIAHELNNPLNNIGLFVGNAIDLVELGVLDKERLLHELHQTMQQVHKAAEIISHLRTFGRAAPVTRAPVLINDVLAQALSLIWEQLRIRQISVDLRLCPENPLVVGNAIQLEQVFVNLLTNARDAVANVPRKEIVISSAVCLDRVELVFHDTGPGIPEGMEQRIFDPFFTTKEVGAGTGLGLSITHGIIQGHQGTISVISNPGEGATFIIDLPMHSNNGAKDNNGNK